MVNSLNPELKDTNISKNHLSQKIANMLQTYKEDHLMSTKKSGPDNFDILSKEILKAVDQNNDLFQTNKL